MSNFERGYSNVTDIENTSHCILDVCVVIYIVSIPILIYESSYLLVTRNFLLPSDIEKGRLVNWRLDIFQYLKMLQVCLYISRYFDVSIQ